MSKSRGILVALAIASAAIVGFAYFRGLGEPLGNGDEAVYAEMIQTMHRSGDYLTLRYHDHVLMQRPPTPVTLYALTARVVSGELGMRLMPAFLTWLTALLAGLFVWRARGRLEAGLVTFLALALTPTVFAFGRVILSDPPFALACFGALAATMAAQRSSRWVPWAAAALGAAISFKSLAAGPPAVALAPWLLLAWWRDPEGRWRRALVSIALFAVLALPYYVLSWVVWGDRFIEEHIGRILLDRAQGGLESVVGMGGPMAYLEHIWLFDGPVVSVLLAAATLGGLVVAWRARDAALGVASSYTLVLLGLLSLIGTRLPHYLLPVYPGAALALGLLVARYLPRSKAVAVGVATLAAAAGAIVVFALSPPLTDMPPSPPAKEFGLRAGEVLAPEEPIYTYDWYAPAVGVYAQRPWHLLTAREQVAQSLGNSAPFRYVGNIHLVPDWPEGEFAVIGLAPELRDAPGLQVVDVLAGRPGGVLLIRARAAD